MNIKKYVLELAQNEGYNEAEHYIFEVACEGLDDDTVGDLLNLISPFKEKEEEAKNSSSLENHEIFTELKQCKFCKNFEINGEGYDFTICPFYKNHKNEYSNCDKFKLAGEIQQAINYYKKE